jgi:hypothetical protein
MATLTIGDTFTTRKSGYVGTITDIIDPAENGHTVLELDNGARYTTLAKS